MRIYNPHIKKLDPRKINGFFSGYAINLKEFWFYCLSHTTKIVKVRNIKFLKDSEPNKINSSRIKEFEEE